MLTFYIQDPIEIIAWKENAENKWWALKIEIILSNKKIDREPFRLFGKWMVGLVGKWGFISSGRLWWKIAEEIIGLVLGKSGSPLELLHSTITGILIWLVNSCDFLALSPNGVNSSPERIIQVIQSLFFFVHLCIPREILGCEWISWIPPSLSWGSKCRQGDSRNWCGVFTINFGVKKNNKKSVLTQTVPDQHPAHEQSRVRCVSFWGRKAELESPVRAQGNKIFPFSFKDVKIIQRDINKIYALCFWDRKR